MSDYPVRVFIGSGEASVLERKTLVYSLRKHCSRDLDIYVFNGTHDSVERNDEEPFRANMPLWIKYQNYTEFSNYRWMIPEICGHEGRAIFLDSDMVCLSDISEFIDQDMQGKAMLAKPEAYKGDECWGMSQVLFDCSKCHFDLEQIFGQMKAGEFTNGDFHQMKPAFLEKHPYELGGYDSTWNVFDDYDENTKLIHYTNLGTQPWKFAGHKHEALWFQYFNEARKAGEITQQDLKKTLSRAYARQDILKPQKPAAATKSDEPAAPAAPVAPLPPIKEKKPILKKIEREIKRLWRKPKKAA